MMMDDVHTTAVPKGGLAVWALGQSGFVMKAADGPVVCIDPCLADPVARLNPRWSRRYPPPVAPEDLRCDIVIFTHDHLGQGHVFGGGRS